MDRISESFSSIIYNFRSIAPADFVDIALIAFVVYKLIQFVRKTRAGKLAQGAFLLIAIYAVAAYFKLRTVSWIMDNVLQIGVLSMVILFQPELRRALEKIGSTDLWFSSLFRFQRNEPAVYVRWKKAMVAICDAAEQLSDSRTGALIVLERNVNLSEIIHTGTELNADVTCEMLGTIFYVGTPLHDGAVIVRDGALKAAGCLLPLSNNLEIGKDMGTRHRAALGMSENSDAISIVVSEETGIISLAKNGVLIRRLDRQTLFKMLEEDISPKEPEKKRSGFRFRRKTDEQ